MRAPLLGTACLLAALWGACKPRAIPGEDAGSVAGAMGTGSGGQGHAGAGPGGAAGAGAGVGGAGGIAGSLGGSLAGTTGNVGLAGAGGATGGAGGTTGVAGQAGGADGAAGAGGTGGAAGALGRPDCPAGTATGLPCAGAGFCNNADCVSCSDRHWRLIRPSVCSCHSTGVWICEVMPGGAIGDCFFDPPLDCTLASVLYEDAACTTHPPCEAAN